LFYLVGPHIYHHNMSTNQTVSYSDDCFVDWEKGGNIIIYLYLYMLSFLNIIVCTYIFIYLICASFNYIVHNQSMWLSSCDDDRYEARNAEFCHRYF
jgi:hypothetical protein